MKLIHNNKYLVALGVAGLLVVSFLVLSISVEANPSGLTRKQSSSATTTRTFITPGAATSTSPAFDLGAGADRASGSAVLALQLTGSSTPSNSAIATTTFNIAIEYAMGGGGVDCTANATNCDWYSDGMFPATTSNPVGISGNKVHTVTLGTQTLAGVLVGSTTPTKVLFEVPTPVRYVRAVISIPLTTQGTNNSNGSVWAEFIATKENN